MGGNPGDTCERMQAALMSPTSSEPAGRPSGEPFGHVPALDGLRALAVLVVLGYHGGVSWLGGGFIGVSAFFTLSGFLVTSLLLREWSGSGHIDLRRFWSRRFRRLLPASWATVFVVIAMGVLGAWAPGQLRSLRGGVPSAVAEVFNWHLIAEGTSYGSTVEPPSPLQHFWSLAVEQQFYVLLPLVLLAGLWLAGRTVRGTQVPQRPLWTLGAVLALLAVASAASNWHFAQSSVDRAYLGTDSRQPRCWSVPSWRW